MQKLMEIIELIQFYNEIELTYQNFVISNEYCGYFMLYLFIIDTAYHTVSKQQERQENQEKEIRGTEIVLFETLAWCLMVLSICFLDTFMLLEVCFFIILAQVLHAFVLVVIYLFSHFFQSCK